MRNFDNIDEFFEFITEAGHAVLELCADPWFKSHDDTSGSFLEFFCRQKENKILIAAAGDGVSASACRYVITPTELSAKVTKVLTDRVIADFFGLSSPKKEVSGASSEQLTSAVRDCAKAV
jgi:hypothetical protein